MSNNLNACPIFSMPPELTSEIFLNCLPDGPADMNLKSPPLLFLQICRRWSDIAVSTPRLWASIHIKFGMWTTPNLTRFFKCWLVCAGQVPRLSISLAGEPQMDRLHDLADTFRAVSHRIQSLNLALAKEDDLMEFLSWSLPLPNLQSSAS
ncbi:hypothetical protein C8F01DRAFT_1362082, partial [Mycena amicta]